MIEYGSHGISKSLNVKNNSDVNKRTQSTWLQELLDPQPSPRQLKVPEKDLLVFFRQLAVVLQSGVALAQGLDLIAENMNNKKFANCISQVASRLSAGEELSLSLKQYPKVFKPIVIGLIEAGEAGGILDQVLDRIALLMEQQAKIKSQIIGAMIYPAAVLLIAVSVGLALLVFIVPRFSTMFESIGSDLPPLTQFMLSLSRFVTSPIFALGAPLGIIAGIYLLKTTYSTREGRLKIDQFILTIPLFGDLILKSEMASMCDTLATLVNSGIPIVEGLDRCITASSNQPVRNTIIKGIVLIKQGQDLSYSLESNKVFPKLVIAMIKIGEETGQLAFMLEKLAVFYARELEAAVSALTKAMEPAVVFVVAIIVGTIVVSLYLPMFKLIQDMNQQAG